MKKPLWAFANWWVTVLLRSPLHPLLSGTVMLITVTGRRTGRRYTTPANYVRDGDVVTAFSRRERTWWRNLQGGAPVHLNLGCASVLAPAQEMEGEGADFAEEWRAFVNRVSPRRLSRAEAARTCRNRVLVRIWLSDEKAPPTGTTAGLQIGTREDSR